MTGDGTHTYQWDAENRMTSVDAGSAASYKYNALGRRVERFLPNGSWTFDYLFGLNGEELGTYSAGTAAWFGQVPMGGHILVQYGSPTQFLHRNNLGTNTVTTDQTGAELQDQLFYPWGQQWTLAGQPYVMHFGGMHQLQDAGLFPTPNRDFTANLGRWMSPDPLGGDVTNPQSLNRYVYALNDPVSNTDPQGLEPCRPGARNYENDCADDGASVDLTSLGNVGVLTPQASEHGVPGGRDSSGSGNSSGFTLGIRQPGQTWKNCMSANANSYSIGGSVELAANVATGTNTSYSSNVFVGAVTGNSINTFFFGSTADAGATMAADAPGSVSTAMGSATTFGRRTSSIMSLNLAGTPGRSAVALSQASGGVKTVLGRIGNALSLGMSFATRTAVDVGFTGAEAINCAIPQ